MMSAGINRFGQVNEFQYCSILRVLRVHPVNPTKHKGQRNPKRENAGV